MKMCLRADCILLVKGFNKIVDDDCYVLYKNKNKFIEIEKKRLVLKVYQSGKYNPVVIDDKEVLRAVNLKMQELGKGLKNE